MCAKEKGSLLEEQLDDLLCGAAAAEVRWEVHKENLLEAHNVISFNTEIKRNKVAKSSTINAETSNAETSKDAP